MHDVSLRLAERVRRLRLELGLTQALLANRAGVTVETVARLERVSRGAKSADFNPTLDTLERLSSALGVDVGELLMSAPMKPRAGDRISFLLRRAHPDTARMVKKVVDALLADDHRAGEHRNIPSRPIRLSRYTRASGKGATKGNRRF